MGFCSEEFEGLAFTDADDESRSRGQLFDIVKMEERETWTARFLRSGSRELGNTTQSTVRFLKRYIPLPADFGSLVQVCVLVNLRREAQAQNVQCRAISQISNLRV